MSLSKEELLKPRYKVIADYPGRKFELGEVFQYLKDTVTTRVYWLKKANHSFQTEKPFFDKYPHLFKKLEWYQDRKPEEMPLYLKRHDKIWKVESWQIDTEGELFFWLERRMNGAKDWYPENTNVFPATEEEYSTYIKKQTTNG